MDEPRSVERMERREFLQKILAAALAVPAGGLLLSGCESGGILEPPGGNEPPPPQGDLAQEVQEMRDQVAWAIQQMQGIRTSGDIDLTRWIADLNSQLGDTWPLMAAAGQQELRANVSSEMQGVLAQLDQFGTDLSYSGPAPAITQQRLRDAWNRAESLLITPAAEGPHANEATWAFFLMLFLIFPTMPDATAFSYALAAAGMDTGHGGSNLYALLHPASPVSCTPCFVNAALNGVLGIIMLLFLAMGSHAAMIPSMLFGRDWLVTLVLLTALLVLFVR